MKSSSVVLPAAALWCSRTAPSGRRHSTESQNSATRLDSILKVTTVRRGHTLNAW